MIVDRWHAMAPRERWLIGLALSVALAALAYVAVWEPLVRANQGLREDLARQVALLDWLERISPEVQRLRAQRGDAVPALRESPMAAIDRSARAAGLAGSLVRIEPAGQDIRVILEEAVFDNVTEWLAGLLNAQSFQLIRFRADRRGPGLADCELVFRPAGAGPA